MRKLIIASVACIALATAGASFAQGRPGGAGGGPGGGVGAGPPISPPGQNGGGAGTSDLGRSIGAERGQFGRDFAAQQHLSPAEYQVLAQQRRADAMAIAKAARNGAILPKGTDARIREALKQDMQTWRDTFKVDRQSWQAMRDQWLVDRKTLSPQAWAEQRAAWFTARDAWIDSQKQWASARSQ